MAFVEDFSKFNICYSWVCCLSMWDLPLVFELFAMIENGFPKKSQVVFVDQFL